MKRLFFLLSLLFAITANAKNYYVSATGNDLNDGQTPATAWKTITKVNTMFSNFVAGDNILFQSGHTFYGTITVKKSGTSGSPIVIGAYGTGAKPVITGFTTATGFTSTGTNLWQSAAISSTNKPNMVAINNVTANIGRYPNSGWLTFESSVANSSITDNQLPGTTNFTGAEVCIRKIHDIIGRDVITSHSGNTINYTGLSGYNSVNGYGYFIQNAASTLDTLNEWYFDNSTKKITVYSPVSPTGVNLSTLDTLLYIGQYDYITVDGIAFEGGNVAGISFGSLTNQAINTTIKNCDINFSGRDAIYGTNNTGCVIDKCNINNSLNNAIYLESEGGRSLNSTITNNLIKNTATKAGMGYINAPAGYNISYNAITVLGQNSLIQYNEIDSTGHCAVAFFYDNIRVKNNLIDTYNFVTDDGGGINTFDMSFGTTLETGREITGNIILNGIGAANGSLDNANVVHGIYMDDKSDGILVQGNSIANSGTGGIYGHNVTNIIILDNTVYNCAQTQFILAHDNHAVDMPIRNIIFKNNTLIAKQSTQLINMVRTIRNDVDSMFSSIDSNYYARPILPSGAIINTLRYYTTKNLKDNYTLATWRTPYVEYDVHTKFFTRTIGGTNEMRFEYNAGNTAKTIALDAKYTSIDSTVYNGTITLQPYSSAVLLRSGAIEPAFEANAGNNEILFLPTNTTVLNGSANGTIKTCSWTKIAGPDQFTIASPNNPSTVVSNLTAGVYTFKFKAINNSGDSALSTVNITIAGVLPVKLIDFSADDNNDKVALRWQVASETGISHYVVERSSDGQNFENIGQLNSNNLNNIQSNYNFSDNFPVEGINYYRLVMIDINGIINYSKTISVSVKNQFSFTVSTLAVSAISKNIKLELKSNYEQIMNLVLADVSGRILYTRPVQLQKGFNTIDKKIPSLNTGVYYVKLFTGDQVTTLAVLSNH